MVRNITAALPVPFSRIDRIAGLPGLAAAAPAGWWSGEGRVLLYDRYDLWGIDPANRRPAINITRGCGAAHKLQLRLFGDDIHTEFSKIDYSTGDTLLFSGFGEISKDNGFVRQVLGKRTLPEILTLGPCLYYKTSTQQPEGGSAGRGMKPIRASGADCWLIKRETASEAPNFYLTVDWRHFREVSSVHPQASYKWLTTELINYTQLDGRPGQGILYKPDDFDPHKRYPVIISYYEQMSNQLHQFPRPGYMADDINIPWLVSRDYLIFRPDIHYETGSVSGKSAGWWAYNSVVAGAKYLAGLPYVDGHHIGLQGHSFGGFETNYLITHSQLFAAAVESAGPADMISNYLSLTKCTQTEEHSEGQMSLSEVGQYRIGATLWQRPDLYLDQSAVLHADKVTTPLLIRHNKKDSNVPWRQGLEWFLALRRLHKRVWMLQYDEGDHFVFGKDALDYTLRLTEFFGYYLKDEPPPKWMTEGIPARLKGIDSGLDSDTSGRIP